jgi:RsiW-degrading membrane proteinase PrsW (M82 family)
VETYAAVGLAFLGGVLPALAWVWFWLREDAAHPEPKRIIALAFFAGMVAVALVIPIQKAAAAYFALSTTMLFTVWSAIEEVVKYFVARVTVLSSRAMDEPIDAVIYMVVVALGFAAVENALFLLSPITGNAVVETIMTGNMRFIGATLLHVLSSAVIGIAIALSFYKPQRIKRLYVIYGVILAILLHSGFNFLILNTPSNHLFKTFGLVWIGVAVMLGILEVIKRMRLKRLPRW